MEPGTIHLSLIPLTPWRQQSTAEVSGIRLGDRRARSHESRVKRMACKLAQLTYLRLCLCSSILPKVKHVEILSHSRKRKSPCFFLNGKTNYLKKVTTKNFKEAKIIFHT